MTNWRLGAVAGVVAGLVCGIVFGIMNYTAALVLLSDREAYWGSLVLAGIIMGSSIGLFAGLIYARTRDSLPGRSSMTRALTLTAVFSIPWVMFWLFTVPLVNSMASSDYMQWIHSFGIEIHWFDINTRPQQVGNLAYLFSAGAYLVTYVLIVIVWIFMFGALLGYFWDKKVRFGKEHRSR